MEPETVARFEREVRALMVQARGDAASFRQAHDILERAGDELVDAAGWLRAEGFSYADIGAALGLSKTTVQERYDARPRPASVSAVCRWMERHGLGLTKATRVTVSPSSPNVGGPPWVVLTSQRRGEWFPVRTMATEPEAVKVAEYVVTRLDNAKFVAKPQDVTA